MSDSDGVKRGFSPYYTTRLTKGPRREVDVTRKCSIFDHTADIGLEGHADSFGELLIALAEGLARLICSSGIELRESRRLVVAAEDRESLVVDFLAEVLRLIQMERFLVSTVLLEEDATVRAVATLRGETYDPARHELATEVKAVTYHQLRVEEGADGWRGRVILDL